MKAATVRVLAEFQNDWDTEEVIEIDGDHFHRTKNCGKQGCHDSKTWRDKCESLTVIGAKKVLLTFGLTPDEVAEAMNGGE